MAKNLKSEYSYALKPEGIDRAVADISEILSNYRIEQKPITRVRLMIESLLLSILNSNHKQDETECHFHFKKRLGSGIIQIQYDGDPFDPLEQERDDFLELTLENLGVPCRWNYKNNTNTLSIFVKRQRKSDIPFLLLAVFAAVLLGLGSRFIPESVTNTISNYIITRFNKAFLSLLNAFAGVLIFFSIVAGMCGDAETEALGKTSRRLLLRQPLHIIIITIVGYLMLLPLFNISFGTGQVAVASQANQVVDLLWGIVPDNLLSPFLEGNYIQIVLLAFVFGIVLSAVKARHTELVAVIGSISNIILTVTEKFCRLIPLFVFGSLFNLIITPVAAETLKDIWRPVVMFLIVGGIISVVVFTIFAIRFKCNILKVLKIMLPALLISLATGTSMAAYSTNLDILENRFGVSRRFSRVGLAVSSKLYGPGIVLYLAVMVVYFAEKYQTAVDLGWMIIAIILTIFLTYACPPIPCSFLVIFDVIAKQLGFPEECIVILATANILLDGLSSGLCCILRNAELIFEAGSYNELDREVLLRL